MKENKMGNQLKFQITIGVILFIIGGFFLLNDFIIEKREQVFSMMNLELSDLLVQAEEKVEIDAFDSDEVSADVRQQMLDNIDYESYVGILEIPKINFNRGFYKIESPLNDVKFNIKILKESNYPDEDKGNVIIIGHSGNYNNSYFGELYKLEKGDEAKITFNGKIYTYQVSNIYYEAKDGMVAIYRDVGKSTLTLITCTKDDETKQTVYVMDLINIK